MILHGAPLSEVTLDATLDETPVLAALERLDELDLLLLVQLHKRLLRSLRAEPYELARTRLREPPPDLAALTAHLSARTLARFPVFSPEPSAHERTWPSTVHLAAEILAHLYLAERVLAAERTFPPELTPLTWPLADLTALLEFQRTHAEHFEVLHRLALEVPDAPIAELSATALDLVVELPT